jgi:hypothetical protein
VIDRKFAARVSVRIIGKRGTKGTSDMKCKAVLVMLVYFMSVGAAFAHHLDEYDERIRQEAGLPPEWFSCRTIKDCDVVSVPCQSDLAINSAHVADGRERLIKTFPFCLGQSIHDDTEASCDDHQCVTKGVKPAQ